MTIKIRWLDVLGLTISGLLLWYTFRQSNADIVYIMKNKQGWLYFFGAQLLFLVSLYIKSYSFKLYFADTFSGQRKISSFPSIMLANFYSALLPGNMGDAVRVYHFSRKNKYPVIHIIAALISEKLSIGLMLCALLTLFSIWQIAEQGYLSIRLGALLTAVITVLLTIWLILWKPRLLLRFTPTRLLRKWALKVICHIRSQYQRLIRERLLVPYFMIILFVYVITVAIKFLLFNAVTRPDPITTFSMAWYYTFVAMLVLFVPSAPSSVGVIHYGIYYAVTQACLEKNIALTPAIKEAAFAFSVWFHLSYLMPDLIIGALMAIKERHFLYGRKYD